MRSVSSEFETGRARRASGTVGTPSGSEIGRVLLAGRDSNRSKGEPSCETDTDSSRSGRPLCRRQAGKTFQKPDRMPPQTRN